MFEFAYDCINFYIKQIHTMRTTITIDDALYEKALRLAGPELSKSDLVREAIETFVRVQAAKRLAALGGTAPNMKDIPRRRAPARPA